MIPKLTPNKWLCCIREELCLRCWWIGHQRTECLNFSQTSQTIRETPPKKSTDLTSYVPKLSSTEWEKCIAKGLCFRCHRKGHWTSSCSFPDIIDMLNKDLQPAKNQQEDEPPELLDTEEDDEEVCNTSPLADSIDQMFPPVPQWQLTTTISPVLISLFLKSMKIPVQLISPSHTLKTVDSVAPVDSDADISCINWQFVRKHHLPTEKLASSITIWNVDQTVNKTSAICYTCTLYTNIKGIAQKHLFYVMGCGWENVILGLPWLCVINLTINWARKTLTIPKSCDQSKDIYSAHATDTQQHDSFFRKPLLWTHWHVNIHT